MLEDIAKLEPGKNAQIAAKKISQKYKLLRAKKSLSGLEKCLLETQSKQKKEKK